MWLVVTQVEHSVSLVCTVGLAGGEGIGILAVVVLLALGLFAVIGMFYGVFVAVAATRKIMLRHMDVLQRRLLTKTYVVEDLSQFDNENSTNLRMREPQALGMDDSVHDPFAHLPQEHLERLKQLRLLG